MQEIICLSDYLPEGDEQTVSFLQLLFDENWAKGELICPDTVYSEVGSINTKLAAKQNYEFLLRAVQKYPLKMIGSAAAHPGLSESDSDSAWESFRTDCYIAGKYCQELQDSGYFPAVLDTLLSSASNLSDSEAAVAWLEKMLAHAPEYYQIDDDTSPILIYKGSSICYNMLNVFAEELAKALVQCHQKVIVFDPQKEGMHALSRYIHQRFKAVIGIQTPVFHFMTDTANFHDYIIGPKFNIVFDHPGYLTNLAASVPQNYYLLLHDRNYINYIAKYYKNIKGAFHFCPAGILPESKEALKIYDVSFIGLYLNYRDYFHTIKSYERGLRSLALRYLNEMKHHPDLPAEKILNTIFHDDFLTKDICFPDLFFQLKAVNDCILSYYREKVIHTLLDAGIQIHVYGESWKSAPFSGHASLISHPEITARENLSVMQRSKISLNIMRGHKDGFTERIANALLCRSVVLSDKTTTLENDFQNGSELILFDLKEINLLPAKVSQLLNNPEQLEQIAQNGYRKACQEHQWIHRARQILTILSTEMPDI